MTKPLNSCIPNCIPSDEWLCFYLAESASYLIGVPETIRTSGPFLRREVLYPTELRGLEKRRCYIYYRSPFFNFRISGGSRPCSRTASCALQGTRVQP